MSTTASSDRARASQPTDVRFAARAARALVGAPLNVGGERASRMSGASSITLEDLADLEPAERWEVAVASVCARRRLHSADDAWRWAQGIAWEAMSHLPGIEHRSLAWGWSILTELALTVGSVRDAMSYATRASGMTDGLWDRALAQRMSSLSALGLVVNGELEAAASLIGADQTNPTARSHRRVDAPEIIARMVLAASRADHAELDRLTRLVRLASRRDETLAAAADTANALSLLLRGRAEAAAARAFHVTHGARVARLPPLLSATATAIAAASLIARGEYLRALATLDGSTSPIEHGICLEMLRASTLLALDRPRDALHATDACLRMGHDHALRSLMGVFASRAVAFERLEQPDAADVMFADSVHLGMRCGSMIELLPLPADTLATLFRRFPCDTVQFEWYLRRARAEVMSLKPKRPRTTGIPLFSRREEVLARALQSGAPMSRIAQDLHLSFNTVKSQTKAVYRKAGVNTRADLIALLDEIGFGVSPK